MLHDVAGRMQNKSRSMTTYKNSGSTINELRKASLVQILTQLSDAKEYCNYITKQLEEK